MDIRKNIALVAHDNKKKDMTEWVKWNYQLLMHHNLICTGTTGLLVEEAIKQMTENEEGKSRTKMKPIVRLKSGPLGGDQQLGAMIAEGAVDILIFFWDPMEPQPHDVDVKALLRIAVVYNIPTACNRSSADFVISSKLMDDEYMQDVSDFSAYLQRKIK